MDELLDDLNEPQREAVLHDSGPLLVLAGAGSGKTRVVTRRIAALVRRQGVDPWRILAVTFTNKAAREMRERLGVLLGPAASGLTVSTFHSTAAALLRREAEAAGFDRDFVIYDDSDQLQLVRRAIKDVGLEGASLTPRELLSRIDAAKNAGRRPHELAVDPDNPRSATVQRVYARYQQLLRAANALDFGDLLLTLVLLLREDETVRQRYQRRFAHVLVDEFQDTNPVQSELLRLLAPPETRPNLVVVGDDDQSVYRWRGAEVENILSFPTTYPGCRVVKLEQNYRSDQVVLEAAHAVISRNRRRMPKKLWSARPRGEPLRLLVARDERHEAQEIARAIERLRLDGACELGQVAVFFRTNAQSRVLEETFRLFRVPYVLVSGRSFYERAEIKDAASYLRLMINPRSDADLLRVVNEPARGIGDTTLERVLAFAGARGCSAYEALDEPSRVPGLGAAAVKRLAQFRALVERLRAVAAAAPDAATATRRMLAETGLVEHYRALGTDEALGRAENLAELVSAALEFDRQRAAEPGPAAQAVAAAPTGPARAADSRTVEPSTAPSSTAGSSTSDSSLGDAAPGALRGDEDRVEVPVPPLQAFLEQISLVGEADGETGERQDRVSLMTLHAAKGLEFESVFLSGLEDGVFPHRRAIGYEASEDDMAEERRLCYVGFTRARRRLVCSLAQRRTLFGEVCENPPSRFLSEVPRELFAFDGAGLPGGGARAGAASSERFARAGRGADRDEGAGPSPRRAGAGHDFDQRDESDVRGRRVAHAQFGLGTVLDVSGEGQGAKLTIRFDSVGQKTVVARFLVPA